MIKKINTFLLLSALLFLTTPIQADTLNVAVASNFAHTLQALTEDFESKTSHRVRVSRASTGKLYTQINHGAPFDIFLAADENRPDKLIAEGKASAELSAVYATGKLVFISYLNPAGGCKDALNNPVVKRLAIANPKTAPYGLAAQQTLEKLQLWKTLQHKLVMGENIAQTLQFVSTGNAQAGFVAKSMLLQDNKIDINCQWDVPAEMHKPIKQKMLVLAKASNKPAVKAFWQYMQSDDAKTIIKNNGYDVP